MCSVPDPKCNSADLVIDATSMPLKRLHNSMLQSIKTLFHSQLYTFNFQLTILQYLYINTFSMTNTSQSTISWSRTLSVALAPHRWLCPLMAASENACHPRSSNPVGSQPTSERRRCSPPLPPLDKDPTLFLRLHFKANKKVTCLSKQMTF